jgi:aminopeptidase
MRDPRIEHYARILVDACVGVQPGWQVILWGGPMARPLVDEVARQIGRRGAYALVRANRTGNLPWVLAAPDELIDTLAPIEAYAFEQADGLIAIDAPENTREIAAIPPERLGRLQASVRPALERVLTNDLKWVGCNYPCPALAQDAGMSLRDYEDFLYGACLLDWDAERERMSHYAERFDAADEVRIVGAEAQEEAIARGAHAPVRRDQGKHYQEQDGADGQHHRLRQRSDGSVVHPSVGNEWHRRRRPMSQQEINEHNQQNDAERKQ